MGRLDGKVALITGAARGQGEAEARLFAREGARVVLADVLDDDGARVARDIGDDARYEHLDVGDETEWTTVVDATTRAFGSLDVLVNNAGILRHHVIEDHPLDEYLDVIRVNQVGCFLGMRAAVPAMRASGGGSIVNTASVAGLVGNAGLVAYTASKFAVRGMTKVAAVELGRYGIRVNSIHPGGVDTAMVRTGVFGDRDPSTAYSYLPLGRIGTVDEVAAMALFLASDESSFSTGSEFVLDGGSTAGAPGRRG
ncbi:MAG TPA: glucose 1-dehydrogenase [Acidimicrobiia bacterium]|nr:glucose 1-dehydrogenase [Acidimicrobiia bacterium]